MDIVDLDGNTHKWSLTGHIAKGQVAKKSDLHLKARELIRSSFPTMQILEEVGIPLRHANTLFLDFYVPLLKLCIEVNGEQHYKFNSFFHGTRLNFIKHQRRDREKRDWCDLNSINVIEFPYNETVEEWGMKLKNHE
ncbi:MAG: hypothetical protein CBC24_06685 [Candidatus Pelagibacter sp. TMED64]|nr:MAG: hypothetical protein CBC24_09785 [Candidatus Pelagibacter sp. TMED64]OUU64810.1 MAG: hypothetical protein CBC24_06685 [Candidatus Pelagibacter sp. TMED64]|tara:strand:+ start:889 stop:1299 length:411 start_codon:yes stop_codon:yes gene_type:complete